MSEVKSTTALSIFQFQSVPLRAYKDANGMPWCIAQDAGNILGLKNVRRRLQKFPASEKGVTICYTLGGPQEFAVINRHGLYRLIFLSQKPEAEAFKLWVFDILDTIDRTGFYAQPGLFDTMPGLRELFEHQTMSGRPPDGFSPRSAETMQRPDASDTAPPIHAADPRRVFIGQGTNHPREMSVAHVLCFRAIYQQPTMWFTSALLSDVSHVGVTRVRDYCRYFRRQNIVECVHLHPAKIYRWRLEAEQDNPRIVRAFLAAMRALPNDIPDVTLPIWEKESDPRNW